MVKGKLLFDYKQDFGRKPCVPTVGNGRKPCVHKRKGAILAVDYGTKRVGLAISDPEQRIAVGAGILEELSGRRLMRAIRAAAIERNAQIILIGQPSPGNRDHDLVIQGSDQLARALAESGFEIILWNEDYTTSYALSERRAVGGKGKPPRQWVDQAAAILTLQSYLDSLK